MLNTLLTGMIDIAFIAVPLGLLAVYMPFGILFVVRSVHEHAYHRLWQAILVLAGSGFWIASGLLPFAGVWWWRCLGAIMLSVALVWGRNTGTKLLAWEQKPLECNARKTSGHSE